MKQPAWKRYLDFWGRDFGRELDDEFNFHVEMRTRELIEKGVAPESARRLASERFGPRQRLRKECESMHHRWTIYQRIQGAFNHARRDLFFAVRQFRTGKSMSWAVLAILAIGIGINSAVFSLVQSVLLSPLPYPNSQELIRIWDRNVGSDLPFFSVSVPHLEAWSGARSLSSIGAYREDSFNLQTESGVDSIRGAHVSAGLFPVLGIRPAAGRTLSEADDQPGASGALMISHGLWQRLYGGSADAIGSSLTLDGRDHRFVGVLPAEFVFPQQAGIEILVPYQLDFSASPSSAHFLRVLGRLPAGVSIETARQELTLLAAQTDQRLGEQEGWSVAVLDLQEATVSDTRASLLLLMGAVGGLLLIACCNVANLYLVQGVSRQPELALRAALGASRLAIKRQLWIEVTVVSLAGAVLGVGLGRAGYRILLSMLPEDMPRRTQVIFSWEVVLFAFGLSLLCGLLIAGIQTRVVTRALQSSMNARHRGGTTRRLTRVLVAAEVAISLALLVGGALLTQSFMHLSQVDPGFQASGVWRGSMTALASAPEQGPERVRFLAAFVSRVEEIDGVQAAALVHRLPLDGNSAMGLRPRETSWDDREPLWTNYRAISSSYFQVLGIPFLEGRDFEKAEVWLQPRGVVVNRSLADLFWPGQPAVGRQVARNSNGPWLEVVGVVADVQEEELSSPPQPAAYLPYGMAPVPTMEILIRGDRSAADLNLEARSLLQDLAPHQGMAPFRPLQDFMSAQRAESRAGSFLVATFAILATVLALVGVVGLVSTVVAGRMHELGVRLVLGATPAEVASLVFRDGLWSAIAGIPVGLLVAWLASGWLGAHVFQITPTDPLTYLVMAMILVVGAGVASYLPARRAARIDPKRVLDLQA